MTSSFKKRLTQAAFVRYVAEHTCTVGYVYPGIFLADGVQVTIRLDRVGTFLEKLSHAMSFEDYDTLTRTVYVIHMKQQENDRSTGITR